MAPSQSSCLALAASLLAACSPPLDWREVRAAGGGLVASFPCRPDRHAREVALAGAPRRMELLSCTTAGATFGLATIELDDPARVAPALAELRLLAAANLGAADAASAPLQVAGMTPNAQAALLTLSGGRPDGSVVHERAALFARGLRVYQATMLGERLPAGAAENFFGALRFAP